ncbi:MAG: hypothetical protein AB7O55_34525, partial [Lautropia sp.]
MNHRKLQRPRWIAHAALAAATLAAVAPASAPAPTPRADAAPRRSQAAPSAHSHGTHRRAQGAMG